MNASEVAAPYYKYNDIRRIAKDFLNRYNNNGGLPVPIERIIEFDLRMQIIPIPGLGNITDSAVSWISKDFDAIYIDMDVYERNERRYRYSLAHEVGHSIMHQEQFKNLSFTNTSEWKEVMNGIPPRAYQFIEQHAYNFAGLVLVPDQDLQEKYHEAVSLVESRGYVMDGEDNTNVFYQYVSTYLQNFFNVSSGVIERRIKYDGLNEMR